MRFNHVGLPVRDERRSRQFYSAYFGFDPATAQEYPDGTVIIRNADGFDLALHPAGHITPPPAFLHSGFKAAGPADVRALMDRMEADGITIVERNDEADYTAFKCLDPDGHRIEVYWEPSPVSSGGCSMTLPPASSNRLSHVGHSIGSGTAKLDGRPTALRLVPSYGHTTKFTHCRIRRTAIMWSLPGVPCVILYLTLQRYYVQGLTSGAVKG